MNLARQAEALGARLPPLLVAAERVASTVAQGVHGRRRTGLGESFWQYRPFVPGDPLARVDWRASARSGRAYVRETEWEAAQTVFLWHDTSPSMRWRSQPALPAKAERAKLLLLALAALLLRGGEQMRLPGLPRRFVGRAALEALVTALETPPGGDAGLPPRVALPRHAQIVLISDFLAPLPEIAACLAWLASIPVTGQLVQVLDPAEAALPWSGRVRFRGLEGEGETLLPRTEAVRDSYAMALAARQEEIARLAAPASFGFTVHHTDRPPETALLTLYEAMARRPEQRG
jgi:uncharacterized protein (DUF58 family)